MLESFASDEQVWNNPSPSELVHILRKAYGSVEGKSIVHQDVRACEAARGHSLMATLQTLVERPAAPHDATSSTAVHDKLAVELFYGSWQLDILFDAPAAQRTFQHALSSILALHGTASTVSNPLYPGKLNGRDGLNEQATELQKLHPALFQPSLPASPSIALALQLVGLALTCSQEGGDGSATQTNKDARIPLELAVNYHVLALAIHDAVPSKNEMVKASMASQLGSRLRFAT